MLHRCRKEELKGQYDYIDYIDYIYINIIQSIIKHDKLLNYFIAITLILLWAITDTCKYDRMLEVHPQTLRPIQNDTWMESNEEHWPKLAEK